MVAYQDGPNNPRAVTFACCKQWQWMILPIMLLWTSVGEPTVFIFNNAACFCHVLYSTNDVGSPCAAQLATHQVAFVPNTMVFGQKQSWQCLKGDEDWWWRLMMTIYCWWLLFTKWQCSREQWWEPWCVTHRISIDGWLVGIMRYFEHWVQSSLLIYQAS